MSFISQENQFSNDEQTLNSRYLQNLDNQRVYNLTPIIQENFATGVNTRVFQTSVAGSGTLVNGSGSVTISTGTTTASNSYVLTRKQVHQRSGQKTLTRFSASYSTPASGCQQWIGPGTFLQAAVRFGYQDTTFYVNYSVSGAYISTAQNAWNGDKADGTQILPLMDWQKLNAFQIEYINCAAGIIKFSVLNPETDKYVTVHTVNRVNNNTVAMFNNETMPFLAIVLNLATTSNVSLVIGTMSTFIQGPSQVLGFTNSINNLKAGIAATRTNILTIRNNSTFGAFTNRNQIFPKSLTVSATTGATAVPLLIEVILNTTLGGVPVYTNIDASTSTVSYDVAGTTITGGTQLYSQYVISGSDRFINLQHMELFLIPSDTLTICASRSIGSSDIGVTINWKEDS